MHLEPVGNERSGVLSALRQRKEGRYLKNNPRSLRILGSSRSTRRIVGVVLAIGSATAVRRLGLSVFAPPKHLEQ